MAYTLCITQIDVFEIIQIKKIIIQHMTHIRLYKTKRGCHLFAIVIDHLRSYRMIKMIKSV